jgi:hypothetical protein
MAQKQRPAVLPTPRAAVDGSGKDLTTTTATPANNSQALRASPRFRRLVEHLHRLGPRPVCELLIEVSAGRDLLDRLEVYADLDLALVARLDGRNWPAAPLRGVA